MLAMKKELDTLKKEREVAPRQKDHESQSVADTAPKRETAGGQAIADEISKSHRKSRRRSCNRKDYSERPNSYLRVGLTGCLRRATAKCPRFRLPLILSSSGN